MTNEKSLLSQLLKSHSLRVTPIRKRLLECFLKSKTALTHMDLESQIGDSADRVTLYRNLHAFHKEGLLHRMIDAKGHQRYALVRNASHSEDDLHPHVHFHCTDCGQVKCLFDVTIDRPELPIGYSLKEFNTTVSGTCSECAI